MLIFRRRVLRPKFSSPSQSKGIWWYFETLEDEGVGRKILGARPDLVLDANFNQKLV